jgi:DNA-binding transcriptional MerR regulator
MFSIGKLSEQARVKIPTIRYYEGIGLMPEAERSAGGQRRYTRAHAERLGFIRHSRDLGFSLDAIRSLLDLSAHTDQSCAEANAIARDQLGGVRARIAQLQKLEGELARIAALDCNGGPLAECQVLTALGDHTQCKGAH